MRCMVCVLVHGVDLPHGRCSILVSQRSKYDDRWYLLNCSVPAVSSLHVIVSATSYPCVIVVICCIETYISSIHCRPYCLLLVVDQLFTSLSRTHVYFYLFAIGILNCRVVAFNPDILNELGWELVSY